MSKAAVLPKPVGKSSTAGHWRSAATWLASRSCHGNGEHPCTPQKNSAKSLIAKTGLIRESPCGQEGGTIRAPRSGQHLEGRGCRLVRRTGSRHESVACWREH